MPQKKEKRHDTALSKRKRQNPQPLPAQRGPHSPHGSAGVVGKPERVPADFYEVKNRQQAVEFVDKAASCTILI
ncbi:hypothetical protein A6O24_19460 [Acidithiobacillus thiooxidans]|nr:hypothetical protein [Acidithiobacillus thiooxidans]OCX68707.1 hypothetical protein A6O24_19460 [Acidithiobacillus thiooxidans]OFC49618.1 hypothetical protein BAE47_04655 [Acidithiobacillus thiooxidans]